LFGAYLSQNPGQFACSFFATDIVVNKNQVLQTFLARHRLPPQFLHLVDAWYAPLAEQLALHHAMAGRPLLVGINGSQGSGKSTLASLLALLLTQFYQLRIVQLSIDDFYLTRESRRLLAENIHPLLATRGVPGTHDLPLMRETLEQLFRKSGEIPIPRFNKAVDDRHPVDQWECASAPLDLVIIEGWCLGTPAQSEAALQKPVNDLEAREDSDATWRRYVNRQISEYYEPIYQMVDLWIMLQAPSFDCVYRWRLEQEQKLADKLDQAGNPAARKRVMSAQQIARFIQHYQRLTEHTLEQLPGRVNYLFQLDQERRIINSTEPRKVLLS
jgi:D-glycerate 3-kinase